MNAEWRHQHGQGAFASTQLKPTRHRLWKPGTRTSRPGRVKTGSPPKRTAKVSPIPGIVSIPASVAGTSRRQMACNSGPISVRPPLSKVTAAGRDSTSSASFCPRHMPGRKTRRVGRPYILRGNFHVAEEVLVEGIVKVLWRCPVARFPTALKITISFLKGGDNAKWITVCFELWSSLMQLFQRT